jgi:hypothetical protein
VTFQATQPKSAYRHLFMLHRIPPIALTETPPASPTRPRPQQTQTTSENSPSVRDDPAFSLADFDRYVEEHGIPEEDYPAAFARWIAQHTDGRVPRFEKVEETGDE